MKNTGCLKLVICILMLCQARLLWAQGGGFGAVYVASDPPGAEILIDGESRGFTPSVVNGIEVGTHNLEVRKPGYNSCTKSIDIANSKILDVNCSISPQFGTLRIKSLPAGARIWVDNESEGLTPLYMSRALAKTYKVRLTHSGCQDYEGEVILDPGEEKSVEIKLSPAQAQQAEAKPNTPPNDPHQWAVSADCMTKCHKLESIGSWLDITSQPSGCEVFLSGEAKGRTPLRLLVLPGRYELKLVKTNYLPYRKTVELAAKKTAFVHADLNLDSNSGSMVFIPAGEFIMGNDLGKVDERPAHPVKLKSYYLDRHDVTNSQYREFVKSEGYRVTSYPYTQEFGSDEQPVVGVSWFDAEAYCKWAGKRLPTEAEWEKAARGGQGYLYPWGANWVSMRCNSRELNLGVTTKVGSFRDGISAYGVSDMAGNVWQWCQDYYDSAYYTHSPKESPAGSPGGKFKVLRGGSWNEESFFLRTTNRRGENPNVRLNNIGFRCAKDSQF